MSMIALVMRSTNATRADVLRVATEGGTTAADWAIAIALEVTTGRPAADIMWAAQARTPQANSSSPTNPEAKHDATVQIYPEDTSPDSPNRVTAHHPGDDTLEDQAQAESEGVEEVEEFAARVYSDLDDLLRPTARSTARLVRSWNTTDQARRELAALLHMGRSRLGRRPVLA